METFGYEIVEVVEDGFTTNVENGQEQPSQIVQDGKKAVWIGKKSAKNKALDDEATSVFLGFVKSHWDLLNDSKTKKKSVWKIISNSMESAGYDLGDNPTVKVDQKWQNLMKSYRSYLKEADSGEDIFPPPYIAEMQEIVGEQIIQPVYLVDSVMDQQKQSGNKRKLPKPSRNDTSMGERSSSEDEESDNGGSGPLKRRKSSKAYDTDKTLRLLLEMQKKREEERCQERKEKEERDKRKEENVQRRHEQVMGALNSINDLMRDLVDGTSGRRRRRRYSSDSERIIELLQQSQRRRQDERAKELSEREERERRREEREKQREENCQKRHEEVMEVSKNIVELLGGFVRNERRTRDSSDSD